MSNAPRLVTSRSTDILNECRDVALKHLPLSLKATLDRIDDALFEIANKADNSDRQNRYFDAMRELRLKRDDFEKDFVDTFGSEFEGSIRKTKRNETQQVDFASTLELSLVETDEVEESLAVTNFVESVNSRCRDELYGLDKRVGALLSEPDLDKDKNPLGPKVIGNAFKHACAQLNSDIEIKLTLYKLFDKYACPALHQMYTEMNQHLVRREVLPTISSSYQSRGLARGKTRVIIENEESRIEASGTDVFSTLQGLMQSNPTALTQMGQHGYTNASAFCGASGAPAGGGGFAQGSVGGGSGAFNGSGNMSNGSNPTGSGRAQGARNGAVVTQIVDTSSLVDTLTLLQHGDLSGLEATAIGEIPQSTLKSDLAAGNVNVLRSLSATGAIGNVNQTDGMTLDIVSILFDYVFDDATIPDIMKALIGRLQIPVLKVALIDKELFSKKSHPARKLIDLLAKSSVGYSSVSADEPYFKLAEKLVQYVVENFTDNVELFASATKKLEEFLDQESSDAQERAERAARSLSTKEQIVHAKMAVDEALNSLLKAGDIREFVRQFIQDYWRQLLIVTHIENGVGSALWDEQLETVRDLIWSISDKTSAEERKELAGKLPAMLTRIRQGMKTLDMDRKVCSKFLSMLASVHVVSVKNNQETSLAEQRLNAREIPDEPLVENNTDDAKQAFIKKGLDRIFENKDVDKEEIELDPSLFNDDVLVEDAEPEVLPTIKNINKYLDQVTAMDLGDWVEFDNDDGTTMRSRFTWISPATGRYLFTTRQGQKAMDTTLGRLVELFSKNKARHIESTPDPIFERALGDLMGRLETA